MIDTSANNKRIAKNTLLLYVRTLFIMLVVTAVFIPLIVAYTTWVYRVLWGKVDGKAIEDETGHAY